MGGRLYRDLPAPLRCEDSVEIDARVRTGSVRAPAGGSSPHLDGAELIAALHATAAASGRSVPPPVLITAAASGRSVPPTVLITAANLTFVRAAGADAILRKPFDLRDLRALIHRFLGGRSDQKGALE